MGCGQCGSYWRAEQNRTGQEDMNLKSNTVMFEVEGKSTTYDDLADIVLFPPLSPGEGEGTGLESCCFKTKLENHPQKLLCALGKLKTTSRILPIAKIKVEHGAQVAEYTLYSKHHQSCGALNSRNKKLSTVNYST